MSELPTSTVIDNPWRALRRFTDARIGLGRAGISLPTSEMLAFQLAHARARDAVHIPLDADRLERELLACDPIAALGAPVRVHSRARTREEYLRRPDLGGKLDAPSEKLLANFPRHAKPFDLAFVIVDGLSSTAIQTNVQPFIEAMLAALEKDGRACRLAAPIVVEQGRVAIGDPVGAAIGADCVFVLIGERPGLSSPDSLGLYMTWDPRPGLKDSRRNCISNIRPGGLSFDKAAARALYLLREAKKLGLSGVTLKDRSEDAPIERDAGEGSLPAPPEDG